MSLSFYLSLEKFGGVTAVATRTWPWPRVSHCVRGSGHLPSSVEEAPSLCRLRLAHGLVQVETLVVS